jgi:hypothetical protein
MVEAVQNGRIHIEKINAPFLYATQRGAWGRRGLSTLTIGNHARGSKWSTIILRGAPCTSRNGGVQTSTAALDRLPERGCTTGSFVLNSNGEITHLQQLIDDEWLAVAEPAPMFLRTLVAAKMADEQWRHGSN